MPGNGQTTVDFGAWPGGLDAQATITGQTGIVAGSNVEAWLFPATTADHTPDEHRLDGVVVSADKASIVDATGFTINAVVREPGFLLYGLYNVGWVWV